VLFHQLKEGKMRGGGAPFEHRWKTQRKENRKKEMLGSALIQIRKSTLKMAHVMAEKRKKGKMIIKVVLAY